MNRNRNVLAGSLAVGGVVIAGILVFYGLRSLPSDAPDASPQPETATVNETLASIPEYDEVTIFDVMVGTGAEAKAGDLLTVHYVGHLTDGTVFDSSQSRGAPFTFTLGAGQVIAGWDVGIVGMKVGGIRQVYIPSEFAYGEAGTGPIPPDADLIFEVELIGIE